MSRKLRQDAIMNILNKQGYVTVKYLTDMLHYSSATINRDLNDLQDLKLIKRSYGGAELLKSKNIPLIMRYNKAKKEKRIIAKTAATYVKDGDVIFIDGTSTTQYMAQYLIDRKDLTVITNNLAIVSFLSEHGIECICLGGRVVEIPSILSSDITVENAAQFLADKLFFSCGCVLPDGRIARAYNLLLKTMMKNSKEVFLLADHEKLGENAQSVLCDMEQISCAICDFEFSKETKEKYPKTKFVCVGKTSI